MSAYPVTDAFKREVELLRTGPAQVVGHSFARMLKEYEHGTANIGDLAPGLTLQAAADVLLDALLHFAGEDARW